MSDLIEKLRESFRNCGDGSPPEHRATHRFYIDQVADEVRLATYELERWRHMGEFFLDCIDHNGGDPVIAIAKSHQDRMRELLASVTEEPK